MSFYSHFLVSVYPKKKNQAEHDHEEAHPSDNKIQILVFRLGRKRSKENLVLEIEVGKTGSRIKDPSKSYMEIGEPKRKDGF